MASFKLIAIGRERGRSEVHHPDAEGDCAAGMTAALSIPLGTERNEKPSTLSQTWADNYIFDKKVNSLER